MALYVISDLHLAIGAPKPMDVFGGKWQGYMGKIEENWRRLVKPEDTVVIGGDISWGMTLQEALPDFRLLNDLPGRKIILRGNHDYWWCTVSKLRRFVQENHLENIDFLFNNAFLYDKIGICGTRGWIYEDPFREAHDQHIYLREVSRLELSFKCALEQGAEELFCFLHYPPIHAAYRCKEIIELLHQYDVKLCSYGHLHSASHRFAFNGRHEGIRFMLTAGDFINFTPVLLKK